MEFNGKMSDPRILLYHAARDATGWATRAVERMKAKSVVRAKLTKGARVLVQWSNTEQYEATVNSWNRYEDRGIVDYDDGTDSLMTFSRIVKVISVPEQPSSSSSSTSEDRQRNRQRRRRERRIRKRRSRHGPKTDNFTDNGASSERRSKKTRTEPKTSSPSSFPPSSPTTSPSSSSSSSSSSNGSKQPNHSDPYLSPGTVYTKRSIEEFKKIVVAVGLQSNDFTTEIKWNEIKVKDHQGNVIRIKQAIKNKINAQHTASHNRTTFRRWWCQYIQVLRTQLPNLIENTTTTTTATATTATTTTTAGSAHCCLRASRSGLSKGTRSQSPCISSMYPACACNGKYSHRSHARPEAGASMHGPCTGHAPTGGPRAVCAVPARSRHWRRRQPRSAARLRWPSRTRRPAAG